MNFTPTRSGADVQLVQASDGLAVAALIPLALPDSAPPGMHSSLCECPTSLKARPWADAALGMAWWNAMTEPERLEAPQAAGTFS